MSNNKKPDAPSTKPAQPTQKNQNKSTIPVSRQTGNTSPRTMVIGDAMPESLRKSKK